MLNCTHKALLRYIHACFILLIDVFLPCDNYKDYFLDDDHTSTLNKQREQFIQNFKVKSESNFPVELVKSKVLLPGLMNVMFV